MKLLGVVLALLFWSALSFAQSSGSITVQGSFDNYYPVTWSDGGWGSNVATELAIGRSDVHANSLWRGSIIAQFRYHLTQWGNGSDFIDADIRQGYPEGGPFIAGWKDGSSTGGGPLIIWLRGGGTTYYYNANYNVNPTIYDDVQNSLPYQIANGPTVSYKTGLDGYVVSAGLSYSGMQYIAGNVSTPGTVSAGNVSANGSANNYFNGNVLIGKTSQTNSSYKLDVNGNIRANQVTVNATGADYVFDPEYKLPSIDSLSEYIKIHHHLPGIPSAEEMRQNGMNVGEVYMKLLEKVEEMTLYTIEMKENQTAMLQYIRRLEEEIKRLKKQI